jgi:hypothetical protein
MQLDDLINEPRVWQSREVTVEDSPQVIMLEHGDDSGVVGDAERRITECESLSTLDLVDLNDLRIDREGVLREWFRSSRTTSETLISPQDKRDRHRSAEVTKATWRSRPVAYREEGC